MISLLLFLTAPTAQQSDNLLREYEIVIAGPAKFRRSARSAALHCRYKRIKTVSSNRRALRSVHARIEFQGYCMSKWAAAHAIPFVAPEASIISEN
jgi:hypothetical protein